MELRQKKKIVNGNGYSSHVLTIEQLEANRKKEIKDDNTPVTNGDIEVNNILTKYLSLGIRNKRGIIPKKPLKIKKIQI